VLDLDRWRIEVEGVVQGVGFRPFVAKLAKARGLAGYVRNGAGGAVIEVEGPCPNLASFANDLRQRAPRAARVTGMLHTRLKPTGDRGFRILQSLTQDLGAISIPADLATCADCAREVFDRSDRRYRYAFANCTNCGPRFSVIRSVPYDRCRTTMDRFMMCRLCAAEYIDPLDRRFHAQPVACPQCGPQPLLVAPDGTRLSGSDPIKEACQLLHDGEIVAVKGLGGFHLACDAANRATIAALRERKHRPTKPLAVMCRDLGEVQKHCLVTALEMEVLNSPAAPVVLLRRRPSSRLPADLAPGLDTLGVMLPYTPLHLLLLADGPPVQVMTSGNRNGLPTTKENTEALTELRLIADAFLLHDREIANRCDDSVVQVIGKRVQPVRRSRGYVPLPVDVPVPPPVETEPGPVVLAVGGDSKNTCCLLRGRQALLGQHTGDVEGSETAENLKQIARDLCGLAGLRPDLVTADLHPGYLSARAADDLAGWFGARRHAGVQHHHAHLASCLAENNCSGPAIGAVLDGTGYGADGTIWGFEVLSGDLRGFQRGYSLAPAPLPGGEAAIRRPWAIATGYLLRFMDREGERVSRMLFGGLGLPLEVICRQVRAGYNSPEVSSCGRLFDAVAAITGVCLRSTYEGEAPSRLASLLSSAEPTDGDGPAPEDGEASPYPFSIRGGLIDPGPLIREVVGDTLSGNSPPAVSLRFHDTVAAMVLDTALRLRNSRGLAAVALSGGVWQNRYLSARTAAMLRDQGFAVLVHRLVPPSDGGISLGQAVVAAWQQAADAREDNGSRLPPDV